MVRRNKQRIIKRDQHSVLMIKPRQLWAYSKQVISDKQMLSLLNFLALLCLTHSYTTASPTWLAHSQLRSSQADLVTSTTTGNDTAPTHTLTFSSSMASAPNLAVAIQQYRGDRDYFSIVVSAITASDFVTTVSIHPNSKIALLSVSYLAVDPAFPYHLNVFPSVDLNASSTPITNLTTPSASPVTYSESVDYSSLASSRTFTSFALPLSSNHVTAFLTSVGTVGTDGQPAQLALSTTIVSSTHFQWTLTVETLLILEKVAYSVVAWNADSLDSSGSLSLVEIVSISNFGNPASIPIEFMDSFIMGLSEYRSTQSECGIKYQWQLTTSVLAFDADVTFYIDSTMDCAWSFPSTSALYLKAWSCPVSQPYFNATSDLCQSACSATHTPKVSSFTCELTTCHVACTNCSGPVNSTYTCLACDSSQGYVLANGSCACDVGFNDTGSSCDEICGDGIVVFMACDDGNTVSGDGCSASCVVETGFVCSGAGASSCTYSSPTLTIVSLVKSPSSNSATLTISLTPVTTNASIALSFPHSLTSTSSQSSSTATTLTLTFSYNQSLHTSSLSLSHDNQTYLLPATSNNLALKYFQPQTYSTYSSLSIATTVLGWLALFLFALTLPLSRVLALQMIVVIQVAFAGQALLTDKEALMEAMKEMWMVNSINLLQSGTNDNLPRRFSSIDYSAPLLSNFNFSLILLALPHLVGLTLLLISKFKPSSLLQQSYRLCFKQWALCALLFTHPYFAISFCLNNSYASSPQVGVGVGCVVVGYLLIVCIVFCKWPDNFGQFKSSFNEDSTAQHWLYCLILLRTFLALPIALLNNQDAACLTLLCLLILWLALLLLLTPYLQSPPPILNTATLIVVLMLYLYSRTQDDTQSTSFATYVPIVVVSLLYLNLVLNGYFAVKRLLERISELKQDSDDNKNSVIYEEPVSMMSSVVEHNDISKAKIHPENSRPVQGDLSMSDPKFYFTVEDLVDVHASMPEYRPKRRQRRPNASVLSKEATLSNLSLDNGKTETAPNVSDYVNESMGHQNNVTEAPFELAEKVNSPPEEQRQPSSLKPTRRTRKFQGTEEAMKELESKLDL